MLLDTINNVMIIFNGSIMSAKKPAKSLTKSLKIRYVNLQISTSISDYQTIRFIGINTSNKHITYIPDLSNFLQFEIDTNKAK